MKKKKIIIALLSVFAVSGASAAMATGCDGCGGVAGRIDAPSSLEAELGAYVVPDYEVVDNNGMILYGYNVYLKSVKNADGEELADSYGSAVTVDEAGLYSFVYSAGSKKVDDVTVSIDFADRTAPTINCDDSTIPKFFITGNSYKVPQYTLSGDFDRSKCWAKVYYIDSDKNETEVTIDGGRFRVDKTTGTYAIRIHVEDAVGNANDYEYTRNVDCPEKIVENKVLYLDEAFGEKQVSCYQSYYKGGYVSKDEDGAHVYGDENGAYKVSFNGESETKNNEGLLVMEVPAVIDITEYEEIYLYVYNDSEKNIIMGSQWWNDTTVEAGKWTRLSWNTRSWGYNVSANSSKTIDTADITDMTIRFIFDYDQKIIPNGTFYLSAMYGTPKVRTELTCGENIRLNSSKYYLNDVIELSAAAIDGKTVDYYTVDGVRIPGDSFTATCDSHTVDVVYVDGELTKDNMSWVELDPDSLDIQGNDAQWTPLGISDYFAYTADIYGVENSWYYVGVQVGAKAGGSAQLLGFEITNAANSKFAAYGGAWKWKEEHDVKLSETQFNAIRNATEENPVKAVFIRRGTELRAYLVYGDNIDYIASVDNAFLGISVNEYGYGQRKDPVNAGHNYSVVGNEVKTMLYMENFAATVTRVNDKVTFDGDKFYLGDKITLKGVTPPAGQMLAYFEVNGKRIDGSIFTVTTTEVTVEAVYTDASELTLGDGVRTSDGRTGVVMVARNSYVTLEYVGNAPAGKVCTGFIVDGEEVKGMSVYVTGEAHTIKALLEDTSNVKLNNIGAVDDEGGVLYPKNDDGTDKWTPKSLEYVTDFSYNGPDGTVERDSLIKVVTNAGENSFALTNGLDDLDGYKEIYYYVYTSASGIQAGGWWCNDTLISANKWTKVSFDRTFNPTDIIGNGTTSVWEGGLENFAIRLKDAPADATVYVTAVYGVPFEDAEITKAADSAEYLTVSAPKYGDNYRINETVTLTCNGAPANKAFVCFTVNGEDITGDTYKLTGDAEIGVRFADTSTVTFADGASAVGGETVFGKGAEVKLTHEIKQGKIFDYYLIDGATQLHTDVFVTTADTHNIKAVYVDNASDMTWANGGNKYDCESVMGAAASSWKQREFDGEVYGSSQYWAISVNVKHTTEWNSFEFIQGATHSLRIRFHSGNYFGVMVHDGNNKEVYPSSEFVPAYPTQNADMVTKLKVGVTITCVRNGGTITLYANGVQFFTTNYAIDHTGDWFGVGFVTGDGATKPTMTGTKFITGQAKVEAYLETLREFNEATSEAQVNNIFGAYAKDGSTSEYITTGIPAGLNDENVNEKGVLKVTAASEDIGLLAGTTFDNDASKYSELYYYIYVESDTSLVGTVAGIYWTEDTVLEANKWNKITLKNFGTASDNLSLLTIRLCKATYSINGSNVADHTSIVGKTAYVTSVYGVPKN